jgi:hypothetical protein
VVVLGGIVVVVGVGVGFVGVMWVAAVSVVVVVVVVVEVGCWCWVLRVWGVRWGVEGWRCWWRGVVACCVVFWVFWLLVCDRCVRPWSVVGVWVSSVVLDVFFCWFSLSGFCRAGT